jgi:citrate synthase
MTERAAAVATKGLEDVVAGSTAISMVDRAGFLIYRGYDIDDLAEHARYEEVAHLLLVGHLPSREELERFSAELVRERELSPFLQRLLADLSKGGTPMDALRTVASASSLEDPDEGNNSAEANLRKATRLTAKMPTIVASYIRQRRGKTPIPPDRRLGHAENFARMVFGEEQPPDAAKILNAAFILQADHGFNASTFTARVVASTTADMHAAIAAALAALKGPLHGGATDGTMRMLKEIGTPERVDAWLRSGFERKGFRVPGFGHRAYRIFDPRAKHYQRFARTLADRTGNTTFVDIQERLVELVPPLISNPGYRFPNVDFFAATTYNLLGLDPDLGTSIFAIGRIAGWCAHVMEQHADNRIIRPESEYTGPRGLRYVPLRER